MKIIISFFVGFTALSIVSFGQCDVVKDLHFPYEKGLVMSLKGKNTVYDKYNFPVKVVEETTHYAVIDSKNTGKKRSSQFLVNVVVDNDTTLRNHLSPLDIDAKGMSWTLGDKGKTTQAISLPLQKGKRWKTYLGTDKHDMICFTTDTLMSLYLGKVKAFGICYEISKGKDERFQYFDEFREWYNDIIGKVATSFKRYGVELETGRVFVFYTEVATLSYTNLPDEKIQEALKICQ